MDLTIFPGKLSGTVTAIPSKSQAHRLLICALKPPQIVSGLWAPKSPGRNPVISFPL